jgi:hypothetical protein
MSLAAYVTLRLGATAGAKPGGVCADTVVKAAAKKHAERSLELTMVIVKCKLGR